MAFTLGPSKVTPATSVEPAKIKVTKPDTSVAEPKTETAAMVKSNTVSIHLTKEQADLVTQFVRGQADLDELKEIAKGCKNAKDELQAFVASNVPNDEPATLTTAGGSMTYGPAPDTRVVTKMEDLLTALRKKIGKDAVFALLRISMEDCDKYLGAEEVEKYITHQPGTRRLAGYVRNDPAAAK